MRGPMTGKESNPFFQEFSHTFTGPIGLCIRKINHLPVVQGHVRTKHGFKSPAEKWGVPLGCVVVAVNREYTLAMSFDQALSRLKSSGRPLSVTFRQLHAAEDPSKPRRYWQGYLRQRVPPRDQMWTGRFYVLREDFSLASYPSRDISSNDPVDVIDISSATTVHGDVLKQFRGGLLAGEVDDAHFWATTFAVLVEEQIIFFRTDTPEAKLDWLSAIAVLVASGDSGIVADRSSIDAGILSERFGSPDSSRSATEDNISVTDSILTASTTTPTAGIATNSSTYVAISTHTGEGGGTVAIGSVAPAKVIKQGYLAKRGGSKLWEASALHHAKQGLKLQPWSQRWMVAHNSGRLLWYPNVPSDSTEVPNGFLALKGAHVSYDTAELSLHLRDDELAPGWGYPFLVRTATQLLFLRTKTEKERDEWILVLEGLGTEDPSEELWGKDGKLIRELKHSREKAIEEYTEHPDSIFKDPEGAYSHLVGLEPGGVSKVEFEAVAGQHFIALCDSYSAGTVFEALATDRGGAPGDQELGQSLSQSVNSLMTETGESDDLGTRLICATPLAGSGSLRLSYKAFERYIQALQQTVKHSEVWDDLRVKLELDPFEVLIRQESSVKESGGLATQGTLYLTDRHIILQLNREVRVIPLWSITSVLPCSSLVGLMTMEDGIELENAIVYSVKTGSADDWDSWIVDDTVRKEHPARGFKIYFSRLKDIMAIGGNEQGGRRQSWLYFIWEMVCAHQICTRGSILTPKTNARKAVTRAQKELVNVASAMTSEMGDPGIADQLDLEIELAEKADLKHELDLKSGAQTPKGAPKFAALETPTRETKAEKDKREANLGINLIDAKGVVKSAGGVGENIEQDMIMLYEKDRLEHKSLIFNFVHKIKVLLRDDGQGLAVYDSHKHRVTLWAAVNLLRARAISKVTSQPPSQALMFCSSSSANFGSSLGNGSGGFRDSSGNGSEGPTQADVLRAFLADGPNENRLSDINVGNERPPPMQYKKWLSVLVLWASQAKNMIEKKEQVLQTFNPNKFKSEWDLLWQLVDPLFETLESAYNTLSEWEKPWLSVTVAYIILHLAWTERLELLIPLLCVGNAAYIMITGSTAMAEERRSRQQYQERRKTSQGSPVLQRSSSKKGAGRYKQADSPEKVAHMDEHPEEQETNTEKGFLGGTSYEEPDNSDKKGDGIIATVKSIQVGVGKMQAKLRTWNIALLRIKALHSWADITRTRLWVCGLTMFAWIMCYIPLKITVTWGVLFVFSRPIRPRGKMLPDLLMDEFWEGLPTSSHTPGNWPDLSSITTWKTKMD